MLIYRDCREQLNRVMFGAELTWTQFKTGIFFIGCVTGLGFLAIRGVWLRVLLKPLDIIAPWWLRWSLIEPSRCRESSVWRLKSDGWRILSHTEKSFRNLIKPTRNQIVFTMHRLIWNQRDIRLVPNQSENGKYNLISSWFNKISLYVTGMIVRANHHQKIIKIMSQMIVFFW